MHEETAVTEPSSSRKFSVVGRSLHVIWLGGAGCDGCTMATLGASGPTIEDLLLGRLPDLPAITLVHPTLALASGAEYRALLETAAAGSLGPFILVLEGSVLDETRAGEGSFSRLGSHEERPLTIASWIDRLTPRAEAVIAIGTCATWGGVPAAAGNVTGAMGLEGYLGRDFSSPTGLPIVNVPGCAPSGDAFMETLVSVLLHLERLVPLDLDDERRPRWLYNELAHPVPARADYLPDGAYAVAERPSVCCPVPSVGWMKGIGGCASVGGACIGCTGRDFADRFLELARPQGRESR
jgi:hydrogenase small subunit